LQCTGCEERFGEVSEWVNAVKRSTASLGINARQDAELGEPQGSCLQCTGCKERFGEVSEWSKEHAWKVCKSKGFEGSNPSLTAKYKKAPLRGFFYGRVREGENPRRFDKSPGAIWTARQGAEGQSTRCALVHPDIGICRISVTTRLVSLTLALSQRERGFKSSLRLVPIWPDLLQILFGYLLPRNPMPLRSPLS
jgi:hypothetical protein